MNYNVDVVAIVTGLITVVGMFVKIQRDILYIQRDIVQIRVSQDKKDNELNEQRKQINDLQTCIKLIKQNCKARKDQYDNWLLKK